MPFIEGANTDTPVVNSQFTPESIQTTEQIVEPVVEPVVTPEPTPTPTTTPDPIEEVEIEGLGKVSIADIKEWRQSGLRQSDYTKKTQELSAQRKESEKALEVYRFLQENPNVAQGLATGDLTGINLQGTPIANIGNSQVEALTNDLEGLKLDLEIQTLKVRYPDFDDIAVLQEADKRGITDLEFVYKALKNDAPPQDLASLKEQLTKEIRAQITDEIRKNGINTDSIISTTDSVAQTNYGFDKAELDTLRKMGIDPKDASKFR